MALDANDNSGDNTNTTNINTDTNMTTTNNDSDNNRININNNNNNNNNTNSNKTSENQIVLPAPIIQTSSIQPGHDHYPIAKPKIKLSKWQEFKLFLWNPKTQKCMGRTPIMWAKLIAFYIVLYTCLAAIWTALFYMFRLTISDRYPKWQLDESIIGMNPGVGFRPQNPMSRVESALIAFHKGTKGDYLQWVESLNGFLRPYENRTSIKKIDCTGLKNRDHDSMCPFDTSTIPNECSLAQNFSYPQGRPCITVKLNRIYGWIPEPYETRPPNYPAKAPFKPGLIQITCDGQHDPDKEHIGPLAYYPQGIDPKYYPYFNQPGYQSPFVMVQFKNPRPDVVIYVECKAWAKNIQHDRYNKRGLTTFEILIEREEVINATKTIQNVQINNRQQQQQRSGTNNINP